MCFFGLLDFDLIGKDVTVVLVVIVFVIDIVVFVIVVVVSRCYCCRCFSVVVVVSGGGGGGDGSFPTSMAVSLLICTFVVSHYCVFNASYSTCP